MSTRPLRSLRFTTFSSSDLSTITGTNGEIYYDNTNKTLRVMSGEVRGGFALARADLTNVPNSAFAAKVAQSATIPWSAITGRPQLFSGNYNDLTNRPTIPSIAGLATESYVNTQIAAIDIPSIEGLATEDYVDTQISNLIDSAPSALNTLNELAAALNDDASFSTTVTNSLAGKAPLAAPTFTGSVTISNNTAEFVQINATDKRMSIGDDDPLNSYYLHVASLDEDKGPMIVYAKSHDNSRGVITTWFDDQYNFEDPTNLNPSDSFGGIMMGSSRGGDFHVGKKYLASSNLEYWQVRNSFMTELLSVNWGGDLVLARKLETNGVVERFVNTIGPIAGNALTMNIKEQANIYYLSSVSANFTVNITITDDQNGQPTSGKIYSATLIIEQGNPAYGPTTWSVNGSSVTVRWQNNASFLSSTLVTDVINLTLIRRSDAWTVLGSFAAYG